TGQATPDQYAIAIRQGLTYANTSEDPDTTDREITFIFNDGEDDSAPVTGLVTVAAVNDPVMSVDDTAVVDEDNSILIDVLANDTDVDASDVLSIQSVGTASDGAVAIESGQIRYTPDPDFNGTDSFTYTVTDGNGGTDTATVNVTINPVGPVLMNDLGLTGTENVPVLLDVLANDLGTDLRIVSAEASSGAPVNFTGNIGDGITLDPSGGVIADFLFAGQFDYDALAPSDVIADVITFVVEDVTGDQAGDAVVTRKSFALNELGTFTTPSLDLDGVTVTGSADINILNGNGLGVVGGTSSITVDSGEQLIFDFDHQAVNVQLRLASVVNNSPVVGALVSMEGFDADGTSLGLVDLTLGLDLFEANLSAAFGNVPLSRLEVTGAGDSFRFFTLTFDEIQGDGFAVVEISGVNDAPVANAQTFQISEDSVGLSSELLDVDDADRNHDRFDLTYNVISAPAGTTAQINSGELDFSLNGQFQGLDDGDISEVEVVYTATDPDGAVSDPATITIQITGANDPVVGVDDVASVDEDDSVLIDVLANDEDVDASDVLTIQSFGTASNGTVALDDNGTPTDASDDQLVYTPNADFTGTDTFIYTVTDGTVTDTATATITINGLNDAPDGVNETIEVSADTPFDGQLQVDDVDIGDTHTYAIGSTLPANGTIIVNLDGTYTYDPTDGFVGLDSFTYEVTDAAGETGIGTVSVEVARESFTSAGGQEIGLIIQGESGPDATDGFGNVQLDVTGVDASKINIAFAADGSGSVGTSNWFLTVDAITQAVLQLREQFAGSQTEVDITVITYATDATALANPTTSETVFDLFDPVLVDQDQFGAISGLLPNLPYPRGWTDYVDGLTLVEDFFTGRQDDANFLFFLSDGRPSGPSNGTNPLPTQQQIDLILTQFLPALEALNVDIETFGLGDGFDPDIILNQMDSDGLATVLTNFADLTGALTATPLFAAELVDFSLQLEADGIDQGQIADQTDLASSGLNFDLNLADIPNIATLLGEDNLFTATATFDLDGDMVTTADQVSLFSTELIGAAAIPQVIAGTSNNDLLFGSNSADNVDGAAGSDVILGFGGNDTIIGSDGQDTILGGAGEDSIDGLAGNDLLTGGVDMDTFVFDVGSGEDTITDFEIDTDVIDLSALVIPDNNSNLITDIGDLQISQDGLDTVIQLNPADQIRLSNVDSTLLDDDDFLF
ncbi:MAG: Ig-like domain-containing protein, partial [Pseudomonadota bacterium]